VANDPFIRQQYKVAEWVGVEHCVYHTLIDAPDQSHRRHAGRKGVLTIDELELFLHSCRG
jgi:hypothetical protein